jgi:hypothetical protein
LPNPGDIKWGPSLWHVFVSGSAVELDGVEDAEHDTTHFVYAGIAKWRSGHQGPAPEYLPTRVDFEMMRPKAISGDVAEKIGEHLVKCKKNKYGSSLCFIGAEADSKRFGSQKIPSIAPSSSAPPPKPGKTNSLSGLALKEESSLSMSSTVIARPPSGVVGLLGPVPLPQLVPGSKTTVAALVAHNGVFEEKNNPFKPTATDSVLNINTYALKETTERFLRDAMSTPKPVGITAMFEPTHMHEGSLKIVCLATKSCRSHFDRCWPFFFIFCIVFKYFAAYIAQRAPSATIWGFFSSAMMPDSCVQELIGALQDSRCQLEHLKLYSCAPTPLGLQSLMSAIDSYGSAQIQTCFCHAQDNFSLPAVISIFLELKSFVFQTGELSKEDMAVICSAQTKFSHLSLVECKISASASEYIANHIKSTPNLKVLDLTSNPIEHEGAIFLGPAIASSNIEHLDLSRTNIGAKGAIDILKALKGKSKLQTLKLDFVKLGQTGAVALADFLPNSTITELALTSTGIPAEKWPALKKAFEGTKSLKTVSIGKTEEKMRDARDAISKYA